MGGARRIASAGSVHDEAEIDAVNAALRDVVMPCHHGIDDDDAHYIADTALAFVTDT